MIVHLRQGGTLNLHKNLFLPEVIIFKVASVHTFKPHSNLTLTPLTRHSHPPLQSVHAHSPADPAAPFWGARLLPRSPRGDRLSPRLRLEGDCHQGAGRDGGVPSL